MHSALIEQGIHCEVDAVVLSTLLTSRAALVIYPEAEQVGALLSILGETGVLYASLGNASNTLLTGTTEHPLQTALISSRRLGGVAIDTETGQVTAGPGMAISTVSTQAAQARLSGLEFASKIPGTIGGAVAGDAGYPIHLYTEGFAQEGIDFDGLAEDVRSVLGGVDVINSDGQIREIAAGDLAMGDKRSIFTEPGSDLFIVRARFDLTDEDPAAIQKVMNAISIGRRAMRGRNKARNRHSVGRTLGHTFVAAHPSYGGASAQQLIADTGSLPEEITIMGMQHSKQTPNIIGNTGPGTADGYLRVIDQIQEAVAREHGVDLPLEVSVL